MAKGRGQPSASWDVEGKHWDVDDGNKQRQRYDENGNPLSVDEAHSRNIESGTLENSNDNQRQIVIAAGGVVAMWWLLKVLSPACGPAMLVCAIVF